jgi:C1A family cysteine protease
MMKKVHAAALNRQYNWKKQKHDARDHFVHKSASFKLVDPDSIPAAIDLRSYCSPVFDQGDLGSCTANALCGALEYLENKDRDLELNGFASLSRLFLYFNERVVEGDVGQDNGAQLRDGIKVLASTGICDEGSWPYRVEAFAQPPSQAAYEQALSRKITAYAAVNQDINSIKHALASGYPIAFGFQVYDSFESPEVAASGIVPFPQPTEYCQGGHAVLMVGYDDSKQMVLVRNSWGADWAQGGYFWMPYTYVTNPNLASDLWVITK